MRSLIVIGFDNASLTTCNGIIIVSSIFSSKPPPNAWPQFSRLDFPGISHYTTKPTPKPLANQRVFTLAFCNQNPFKQKKIKEKKAFVKIGGNA